MTNRHSCLLAITSAALLAACGGQPQTYSMGPGEQVTMPKGTMTGGASAADANALAKMVADENSNAMAGFDKVNGQLSQMQSTEAQSLKTSQQALADLEKLSAQQGSGDITLFFKEGSARLDAEEEQRLVRFLDYLARESRGRKVILVSIGSASAIGSPAVNRKLSVERSNAPLNTIDQYLVNTPHTFYKVSAVGDMYAPKSASYNVEKRYQSVRIIAVYDQSQLPK
jgi:outer membrane protein OmpA-like peptidoglycan-associated protein